MTRLILLDAGPLGLVTSPRESGDSARCKAWLWSIIAGGDEVTIPALADYEVRRELVRARRDRGLARLDELGSQLNFVAVTREVLLYAAELWAWARDVGLPTAGDAALDADVILASQAALLAEAGHEAVVATRNVRHLARFPIDAREWEDVAPAG